MLNEAPIGFLNGEPHVARLILRDPVNTSVGFGDFATQTNRPSISWQRMFARNGNPSMDKLAASFGAVRKGLGVAFGARGVETA